MAFPDNSVGLRAYHISDRDPKGKKIKLRNLDKSSNECLFSTRNDVFNMNW